MTAHKHCFYFFAGIPAMVVCFFTVSYAQTREVLKIRAYDNQSESRIHHVNGFSSDRFNRLYIATPMGLFRHNGSGNVLIDLQQHDSSISTSCSRTYSDAHGRIWFANYPFGWGYYNPYTNKVCNFANECNIALRFIHYVYHDSKGRYWIASDDEADTARCGLYLFNPVTKHLTQFKFEEPQRKHYRENSDKVTCIVEDKRGNLWLSTWNGIVCFNTHTGKYQTFINQAEKLKYNLFTTLLFANDSILLAGSWGRGLIEFNVNSHQWDYRLSQPLPQLLGTHNIVLSIVPARAGKYLVATLDAGLFCYDVRTHTFSRTVNELNKQEPVCVEPIAALHTLPEGHIVAGGGKVRGFYTIDEKSFRHSYYFINPEPQLLHDITYVNDDSLNHWYVALTIYGKYFYAVNRYTHEVRKYNPFGFDLNGYEYAFKVAGGSYYINSHRGAFLFHPVSHTMSTDLSRYHPVLRSHTGNYRISDNGNILWIYHEARLYKFSNSLQLLSVFDLSKQLGDKYFWWQCMFDVMDGRYFYTANRTGWLICIDLQTLKKTECYRSDFKGFKDIYRDKYGRLWECDYERINEITWPDDNTMQLRPIKYTAKRAVTKFTSISSSAENELCFHSDYGLLTYNILTGQTADIPFVDDMVEYHSGLLPVSRKMFYCTDGRFVIEEKRQKQLHTVLQLDNIEVMGEPLQSFNDFTTHHVTLAYWQNAVNISFSVNGFYSDPVTCFYYLVKGNDTIQTASGETRAIYNNLSPGDYTFYLYAKNKITNQRTSTVPLTISIVAPWWQTLWFYTLLITLVVAVTTIIYRLRVSQVRKESQMKARLIEADLKALRSQMNPHFIFNSLNSINRYIIKSDPKTASDYLTKFAKLIRLIFDNSSQKLIPLSKELGSLQLYIELEQLRFTRHFLYAVKIDSELDTDEVLIQPLLLQPFVENAIWHGLMHKQDGNAELTISFSKKDERIICVVNDNGIGRAKAASQSTSLHEGSRSRGMEVTINRLKMADSSADVTIGDLTDESGNVAGTTVMISFEYIESAT